MAQFGLRDSLPPVVKNLLIANVLVFLAQQVYTLEPLFALWPVQSGNFWPWQLVTMMFMHGNFVHILFNMIGLWMFGSILENYWGAKRFLQFYVICGLVAGCAHLLSAYLSNSDGYAIGASGAVMGIFAGFAYLFPNTPLYLMFIPIPIKAKWAMPGLILIDVFGAIAPQEGDNIAHWAHIGGAAAGLCLVILWNKRNRKTFY